MRTSRVLALVVGGMIVVALVAGCSSGGSSNSATATAPAAAASVQPAASAQSGANATATAAARRAASALEPAMPQAADLPADLALQPPQVQLVHPGELPGLQSTASGETKTAASADNNEFVTVIGVLPDDGNAQSMLDAFTLDNYLPNVTGDAEDAQGSPLTVPGAPDGAKAFSYSGSPSGTNAPQHVDGEVVAFVQSGAFVVVNHGRFAPSTRTVDIGQLASKIAQRLASPGLD